MRYLHEALRCRRVRAGSGSARIVETVLAMAQAPGTAAAVCVRGRLGNELRRPSEEHGALVDGTH